VGIEVAADGEPLADCLGLEVVGDRGDLYTHSPIPGTHRLGAMVGARVVERGPIRATLQVTMQAVVPAREVVLATGERVTRRATPVRVVVLVRLHAGSPLVTLEVRGTHVAPDARVRLRLATGIRSPDIWADAPFGAVARPPLPAHLAGTMGGAREVAVPSAPLHRYVSLYAPDRGVSVLADGLAEYEAGHDGTVAVTLVRAVGELSRHDLPERPGHAGWPVATPLAQSLGSFEANLALMVHGPRTDTTRLAVHLAAESWLLPLTGDTWGSAVEPPARVPGVRLEGDGLAYSSCKPAEDGQGIVVRCVNLLDRAVEGRWTLAGLRRAWMARLDETPLGALAVRDGSVTFHAPSRATVTIRLVR
jgi:mannosylglycerate hydrolase